MLQKKGKGKVIALLDYIIMHYAMNAFMKVEIRV
jgi:hypothetical protein